MNNPFIPNQKPEQESMLKLIGKNSMEELYCDVPSDLLFKGPLNMPNGLSEYEVMANVKALADKNCGADKLACFMGAGAYDIIIPSAINHLRSRTEFYTAYTPYQPEISQGTLQVVFEYQTYICEFTGMYASNASMYDGATALTEAAFMAQGATKKDKVVVSKGVAPESIETLKTYAQYRGLEVVEIPLKNGVTDIDAMKAATDKETAAVIVQNPNFLGQIEDIEAIGKVKEGTKALYVVAVNDATSMALAKTPAEAGADVAVGEAQAFGIPMSFGGPYCGFMATTQKLVRKMPGRIVGASKDVDGKRAFVLTLCAREQHIKRDKATSNICSNQGLMALTTTMYLAMFGKEGIKEVALQSASKARYLEEKLNAAGFKSVLSGKYFREFVVDIGMDVKEVNKKLVKAGFIGGYSLKADYPELGDAMLVCVTEKRSQEEMDKFVSTLQDIKEGRI